MSKKVLIATRTLCTRISRASWGRKFQTEKNYEPKKEFVYRMCARRRTSAMPKPRWCHLFSLYEVGCGVIWKIMRLVATCRVMWCHVIWWDAGFGVMSCHVMRCDVLQCPVMSCDVMSDVVMWSDVKWCHGIWLELGPMGWDGTCTMWLCAILLHQPAFGPSVENDADD